MRKELFILAVLTLAVFAGCTADEPVATEDTPSDAMEEQPSDSMEESSETPESEEAPDSFDVEFDESEYNY